jgi:methyl-accepting chemotaxis protein
LFYKRLVKESAKEYEGSEEPDERGPAAARNLGRPKIMMRLRDLGLRTKIAVSVVVPLLTACAVGVVAIYEYRSVRSLLADVRSKTEILFLAGEIEDSAREAAAATARTGASEQRALEQVREKALAQVSEKFAAIKGMLKPGSEERKLITQAEESLRAWLGKKGEKTGTQDQLNEFENLVAKFTERLKRLIADDLAPTGKRDKVVSTTLVALGALTALIAILAIYLLSKTVVGPIKGLIGAAEAGGRGDLIASLQRDRSDEIGQLVASLNDLVSSLVSHSAQLAEGVNILAESGGHIASAASQLFAGASQTASAVSETTSIVQQMEQTAKVVNDTARNVADRSRRSDEVAAAGKKATVENVEQMSLIQGKMELVGEAVVALSNKTRDIEEIIVAVQDLAEQSNLLAVNASIEAARAGDQG